VRGGGVVWVNNDVISIFGIKYATVRSYGWHAVCHPAITPVLCPVVTDCERAELKGEYRDVFNLQSDVVFPLMADDQANTWWSLVPYGKGWVSNVPGTIDESKYEGPRLWLNFRLFCLSWAIPGAPAQRPVRPEGAEQPAAPTEPNAPPPTNPTPPAEPPTPDIRVVTTNGELDAALAAPDQLLVLWVRLANDDLSKNQLDAVRDWVRGGGVLWTDTDLAKSFGFTVRSADEGRARGQADIPREANHPIVNGLAGKRVGYTLSATRPVVECTKAEANSSQTPLLWWSVGTRTNPNLVQQAASLRTWGDGLVVLRPAEIDTRAGVGQQFEANLKKYCIDAARRARGTSQPDAGVQPDPGTENLGRRERPGAGPSGTPRRGPRMQAATGALR